MEDMSMMDITEDSSSTIGTSNDEEDVLMAVAGGDEGFAALMMEEIKYDGNTAEEITEFFEGQTGEIQGRSILKRFPSDLHFICGCANFDPSGHNHLFREVARDHFRSCFQSDPHSHLFATKQIKVRSEIPQVLARAHAKAQQQEAGPANNCVLPRFRIWKTSNHTPRKRLSESTWEDTTFVDVHNNMGSLKQCLDWPLRRALEDVRKELGIVFVDQDKTNHHQKHKQSKGAGGSRSKRRSDESLAVAAPKESCKNSKRAKVGAVEPVRSASSDVGARTASVNDLVQEYVDRFNHQEYLDTLDRLDQARGTRDIEEWAKDVYTTLRDQPDNQKFKQLNMDRKKCLNLLYDLVNAWEKHGFSNEFERAIRDVFKCRRLVRILAVCLPLDRAQSLYKMRNGTDPNHGMPWYSKLHQELDTTSFARDHPQEQKEWIQYIDGYPGNPTMNKRLFRLLFSDHLGLQSNETFRKWSMPAKVPNRDD